MQVRRTNPVNIAWKVPPRQNLSFAEWTASILTQTGCRSLTLLRPFNATVQLCFASSNAVMRKQTVNNTDARLTTIVFTCSQTRTARLYKNFFRDIDGTSRKLVLISVKVFIIIHAGWQRWDFQQRYAGRTATYVFYSLKNQITEHKNSMSEASKGSFMSLWQKHP